MSDHRSISSQSICPQNNGILILSNLLFSVTKTKEREQLPFQYLRIYYQIRGKHCIHRTVIGSKYMHKLCSHNNWHYKNSTQLFFDSQNFFTEKKLFHKNELVCWWSFIFFEYFAFIHYHAKINGSDLTKLKE